VSGETSSAEQRSERTFPDSAVRTVEAGDQDVDSGFVLRGCKELKGVS
jgi:hypothetical protein